MTRQEMFKEQVKAFNKFISERTVDELIDLKDMLDKQLRKEARRYVEVDVLCRMWSAK